MEHGFDDGGWKPGGLVEEEGDNAWVAEVVSLAIALSPSQRMVQQAGRVVGAAVKATDAAWRAMRRS